MLQAGRPAHGPAASRELTAARRTLSCRHRGKRVLNCHSVWDTVSNRPADCRQTICPLRRPTSHFALRHLFALQQHLLLTIASDIMKQRAALAPDDLAPQQ